MRKIFVTAFLKTLSPLHIAAPSSMRYDPSSGQKTYSDIGTVPCSTVQRMMVATPLLSGKSADTDGQQKVFFPSVPVIAANNLAGRIRRYVADVFLRSLKAQGEKASITTYNAVVCGAATGNPDGESVTYDEYARANQHPFLGVMGGGPRMMQRRAKVHNAFAYCRTSSELLEQTRVPYQHIYDNWDAMLAGLGQLADADERNLTQVWTYRRNDDLRELVDMARASESIRDFMQAFNARQSAIIEEAGKGGDSKTSTFTFQALEFVVPGAVFPVVFELKDVTDEQAGLWFRGFQSFCEEECLGGITRNGFGEFVMQHGRVSVFEDGEMVVNEALGEEDGFRMQAIEKWVSIADQQKADEIDFLMRLPKPKKEKAKKVAA